MFANEDSTSVTFLIIWDHLKVYPTKGLNTFRFCDRFIDDWELMTRRKGAAPTGLTSDTFKALRRTNKALPALIRYLLQKKCNAYVLTAKILNDGIEARFGVCRHLSGSSYHVTVVEVMEAQKKIQVNGCPQAHKVSSFTLKQ